jgi:hypothetical protein
MGPTAKETVVKIFAAFVMLMLSASAFAGGAERLTGREIEDLFAGTTMSGDFPADGARWSERTTRSGRVLDMLNGGKHAGTWFVAGNLICYVYYGQPPAKPCYMIGRDGKGTVLFHLSTDGSLVARATLIKRSRR